MDLLSHAQNIGSLVSNLQSIEFQLRCILAWAEHPRPSGIPVGKTLAILREGEEYEVGAITDYASLRQLVQKFNALASERKLRPLDPAIITLRDALAHGRCTADPGEPYFRLLKFSKVKAGRVTVEYNQVLDSAWYERQSRLLSDTMWVLDYARQQP